jgi:hypothetical protein
MQILRALADGKCPLPGKTVIESPEYEDLECKPLLLQLFFPLLVQYENTG